MAVFKCKMCGGALEINNNETVAECEYCGSKQTVPTKKDEVITNLFNRANNLRLKNEFDKAAEVYSKILNENDADAEAHWGLVLCKYGIEYVEDPKTYKRIPTCHRTQYTSVLSDTDYLAAIENADVVSKEVYTAEAHEIAELQKSILAIVKDEKPFDVFICYKETDENGKRTVDSTLANDIYYQLTKEGMRVFYAAITLEDKLGVEYEPYIFAALNSAKVMLVIGTKPEYFNAVWVRNEWSRYLGIMKTDREKMLIPCYRDMDAYDLPEEFAHLQAQDMSKIGFINDLVRGIKKVTVKDVPKATENAVKETVVTEASTNIAPLLKRAFMFLEDSDWNSADEYCEKVLDIDPENAQAYLGKLMAELRVRKQESLKDYAEPFDGKNNYQKILRFGDETLKNSLVGYIEFINIRNENNRLSTTYNNAKQKMISAISKEAFIKAADKFKSISEYKDSTALAEECLVRAENARLEGIYAKAKKMMSRANTESAYKEAAQLFETISEFKDSAELIQNCFEKAEKARKNAILEKAKSIKVDQNISKLEEVIVLLKPISGHKDTDELIAFCEEKIAKLQEEAEQKRIKAEQERIKAENTKKQIKKILKIATLVACVIIVIAILVNSVIIPNGKYKDAIALMDAGNIVEAYEALVALDGYKDSADKANSIYDKYKLKVAKVGDYVFFGTYEQDNNTSNGKEDVEWLVLEVKDGKALVISKYALDSKTYNTSHTDVTWETCTLRKWLNNDFINAAFSADEKSMIPAVTVSADKNPEYSTNPGKATQDQVFLLSIPEANKYFNSNSARQCEPTDYAVANGAWEGDSGNCWWWLRSPGYFQHFAAGVNDDGDVGEYGLYVGYGDDAVRPALWIDLNVE